MRALYLSACSRIACSPSASSCETSPVGASLPRTLAITRSDITGVQIDRIMRAVIIPSRPKYVA
jgi:hypothetical protein